MFFFPRAIFFYELSESPKLHGDKIKVKYNSLIAILSKTKAKSIDNKEV